MPLSVRGVRLGVAQAGIKQADQDDLVLIELAPGSTSVGLFTQNAFRAAPVQLAQQHLKDNSGKARYWLINTGNANAGTGLAGYKTAENTCLAVAEIQGCHVTEVLPFSTGVIGEPLSAEPVINALPYACADLAEIHWQRASQAILTTDTRAKLASRVISVSGSEVTLTGMAKGAGMIRPDMATMLAFVATDAEISSACLDRLFRQAVSASFNRITVDGDTSTNDAAMMAATGCSGIAIETEGAEAVAAFTQALESLCLELAQAIIRDGEGATKFVEVQVDGGADADECDAVAYTIAHSPLVKTALFASDPNWGRLLAAIGRAGLNNLRVEDVSLYLNDVLIAVNGARAPEYTEAQGQIAMAPPEVTIRVDLKRGASSSRVWTTDFSYDYVRINAEYRT
jgi:glutamate N-acetyltransferase/amino-acid N-acetyltransferase